MGRFNRTVAPTAPRDGARRDDRLILVVSEDTYAPAQYFELVRANRVRVEVAPAGAGQSSPQAVLEGARILRKQKPFSEYDECWLLMDTDHWFSLNHRENTMRTISEARAEGFRVALSNPCFELWLLLHHEDISPTQPFEDCKSVEKQLKVLLGGYNKGNVRTRPFAVENALAAISRGKQLTPDTDAFPIANPGTQVWRLTEVALTDEIRRRALPAQGA